MKKKPIGVTMSMEAGIGVMATKVGMMSFFQPDDKVGPVTDRYDAVQVCYRRVKDRKHKWVISREGQRSCLEACYPRFSPVWTFFVGLARPMRFAWPCMANLGESAGSSGAHTPYHLWLRKIPILVRNP
ncbi:PREDICTED: 50S ribosomal [Prunus dulcis]|uniref:PREDICTED: 50S ribosomal n=1 Tax=Prunus dulcis TaxID=3755 RepID=A0A5E4FXH3_PRUDU|nr:PREDICTED: 50S ribosomal [Prunus dulcis]